jgi:crossover junction endodeoxyribonuclease RusA
MKLLVMLPLRTVSEANTHGHWRTKAKRVKMQRTTARMMLTLDKRWCAKQNHFDVRLTRIAPKKLDSDNLAISNKAIRDGIADAIGIDDGSSKFSWEYRQETGRPKEYAVKVEITIE